MPNIQLYSIFLNFIKQKYAPCWPLATGFLLLAEPATSSQEPVTGSRGSENKFDRGYYHLIMKPKLSVSDLKREYNSERNSE